MRRETSSNQQLSANGRQQCHNTTSKDSIVRRLSGRPQ